MSLDNSVMSSKGLELVGCSDKLVASHLANFRRNVLRKANKSVDSRTNCRSSLSEHLQTRQACLYPLNAKVELLHIAGELLAQSQRRSVLQMCSANLDQVLPLVALLLQGIPEALQGGEERLLEVEDGGDVHDGREGVVGRGGHVDVVIGVDGLLAAHCPSQNLDGAVGNDLVGVHVGLSARACLPHNEWEVINKLEGGHLFSRLLDSRSELWVCILSAT
jgi:hypothetical protein